MLKGYKWNKKIFLKNIIKIILVLLEFGIIEYLFIWYFIH